MFQKARDASVPLDTIERAIKRGTGELEGVSYEQITYEGYAPGGVALLVEVLTDNRNRTGSDVRSLFTKRGGSMAEPGAVAWQFERKGIDPRRPRRRRGRADARRARRRRRGHRRRGRHVAGRHRSARPPRRAHRHRGGRHARRVGRPDDGAAEPRSRSTTRARAKQVLELVDALEDLDDVQDVYANFDIPDEILEGGLVAERRTGDESAGGWLEGHGVGGSSGAPQEDPWLTTVSLVVGCWRSSRTTASSRTSWSSRWTTCATTAPRSSSRRRPTTRSRPSWATRTGEVVEPDTTIDAVDDKDYDLLLIPGGALNADHLRMDDDALGLIKAFTSSGRPVAAICHTPWTLIEADVVDGKRLTSYASLQTDVRNAGGSWVDEEVVTDDVDGWTLVTSRTPDDLDAFLREVDNALLGPRPLSPPAGLTSGRQQGSERVEGRLDVGGWQRPEPDHEAVANIGGVVVPAQRADQHPTGDRLTGLDGESAVDHDGDVQTGGARQQAGALVQPPQQPVDQQLAPLAVHASGPAEVAVELAALDERSERLLGRPGAGTSPSPGGW